ncbi:carboxylate/amino acid/amine transporter [Paenibacillus larvae subsp. larvae]|uniref:Carboxylate/amino acid/amine transporter n=1 Tax=Paenibacillus larvae subsp. larvae TaxID=147375 RepID=A0A2L1UIN7_9BACL|nr:DMT family transporter [Paenibacillus larvae]AQT84572.1 EamA family transporter [Paenibacillus larvae subsp. pulvifaciens]AQZ46573.1 EamA family transporter [Paenibacillus larvae subsp. pulvifaciens]AVF28290.1 carboxylate/amino acid/amine transporter [Paenibacillus larvae subsp. larvae]AVF32793.1 carboxylate/amino acid/amine transporter [Paenibacillus larvae subsp. larvae]MBH0343795.1 membrane protein [Paenibacillus larvae]
MWVLYAFGAAVLFGLRGVLYQWTSSRPIPRDLMLFAVYVCGAIISILLTAVNGQTYTMAALLGCVMGLLSYISNSAMYKGFATGKASLVALLTGLSPVVVVLFAFGLWGETLTVGQIIAFLIILSGMIMIRYSGDLSLSNIRGAQWGLLAMLGFAFTDITSKQSMLWGGQTLPILVGMYVTGAVLFGCTWIIGILRNKRDMHEAHSVAHEIAATLEQPVWPASKTVAWGLFVGLTNIFGMVFLLKTYENGITGLVSAIEASNVLLVIFYARLFLKEKFSRMEVFGITFTIAGLMLIRLIG